MLDRLLDAYSYWSEEHPYWTAFLSIAVAFISLPVCEQVSRLAGFFLDRIGG